MAYIMLLVYNIVIYNFKDYAPFIIINYWSYSLDCTIFFL